MSAPGSYQPPKPRARWDSAGAVIAFGVPAAVFIVVFATWLALSPLLPDEFSTSASGGHSSTLVSTGALPGIAAIPLAMSAVIGATAAVAIVELLVRRLLLAIAVTIAIYGGGTILQLMVRNTLWPDSVNIARDFGGVVCLVVGIAAGIVAQGYLRDGYRPSAVAVSPPLDLPRVAAPSSGYVELVQLHRMTPPWILGGLAALTLGVVLLFFAVDLGAIVIVATVALWVYLTPAMRLNARGIEIVMGGFSVLEIPIGIIAEAREVHVAPSEYGGIGFRTLMGEPPALVFREGPAVRIQRSDGRVLIIGVRDAGRIAGLINSYADTRLRRNAVG